MRLGLVPLLASAMMAGPQPLSQFTAGSASIAARALVATVQPRPGGQYAWLRVYFYAPDLSAADRARASDARASAAPMRWQAALSLSIDAAHHVWQMDVAVPGHTCTVAATDRDAAAAIQTLAYDERTITLHSTGTFVCDLSSLKLPSEKYSWAVTVDALPVTPAGR